ncbi:MAG TPA: hypothetical protein VFX21_15495, partial [Acidimicrobiia bacterium]|nr:hypothetical protein [Acidimicrobiia bacterium]
MRWRLAAVLLILGLGAAAVTACSGDDDDSGSTTTVSDPGPNSTISDPGPNDTSSGPSTIVGIVAFTTSDGCITLTATQPFSLRFDGFTLQNDEDANLALVADDDGRVLSHNGDQMFVTGRENGETDACGTVFVVESLNSVVPTATT